MCFLSSNRNKSSEGSRWKPEGWWKSYNKMERYSGRKSEKFLSTALDFYDNEGNKTLKSIIKRGKRGFTNSILKDEYVVENWHKDTLSGNVNTYDSSGWVNNPFLNESHGMEKVLIKRKC